MSLTMASSCPQCDRMPALYLLQLRFCHISAAVSFELLLYCEGSLLDPDPGKINSRRITVSIICLRAFPQVKTVNNERLKSRLAFVIII
jgi:hypothetical protein